MVPDNSLTQQSECTGVESGCLRILSECLGDSSMRLGVPFIALSQLGVVEDQLGRPILPSVEWCTGQSGAPPDNNCSCPVLDFFHMKSSQPLVLEIGWRDHVSGEDCAADRWRWRPLVHRMVQCTTGQSGEL
jgi:hypothetical protein